MLAFFRRVWSFARPYSTRLVLGQVCGILFALANGLLFLIIKLVIDLIFSGAANTSLAAHVQKAPALLRPLLERLVERLPELKSPTSGLGLVLVVSTIPAVMLLRGIFSYLNIYLVNWAAMRAIADLRTRLFDHLQNLSLDFFSRARTGELISRTTNGLQSGRGSIRESVRRSADAAAAYVSASVQVARRGGAGGDHTEIGIGRTGAIPHQNRHR